MGEVEGIAGQLVEDVVQELTGTKPSAAAVKAAIVCPQVDRNEQHGRNILGADCSCSVLRYSDLDAKVPGLLGSKLDERATAMQGELDEAQRLREEAQELLAEYERKKVEAEKRRPARSLRRPSAKLRFTARKPRKKSEQIERRTSLAEQKIAQAEAAAVKDVRAAASDLAIEAAARIIGTDVKGAKGASLVDNTIAAVRKQLN